MDKLQRIDEYGEAKRKALFDNDTGVMPKFQLLIAAASGYPSYVPSTTVLDGIDDALAREDAGERISNASLMQASAEWALSQAKRQLIAIENDLATKDLSHARPLVRSKLLSDIHLMAGSIVKRIEAMHGRHWSGPLVSFNDPSQLVSRGGYLDDPFASPSSLG